MFISKISSLKNNKEFYKYFKNTSWLFAEKILRIIASLFIGIWVARYLGPEQLGDLYYTISLVSLIGIFTHLGLDGLVVKEIVNHPDDEPEIIGTVFYLKIISAAIGFLTLLLINILTEELYSRSFWMILILSFMIFLKPFETINFWFNAKVLGKFYSLSSIYSIISSNILKVLLIFGNFSLVYFVLPNLFEIFVLSSFFIYYFFKLKKFNFVALKFSWIQAIYLLKKGWVIMLAGIFAIIYLKIDQVMLKWLSSSEQVGFYSLAASLSEVWYFIPIVVVSSLFPKIIELKKIDKKNYEKKLQKLFNFLFLLGLCLAIFITLLGDQIISILYGLEYKETAAILKIHIWAGVFIFMRALVSKWIIVEDILIFALITQGLGAISNLFLNYLLIPKYGGIGAAVATLISYSIASYIALIFHGKSRLVFYMMSKSILSPITLTYKFFKDKNVG